MAKITLGAPSLSGKDANDLVSAAFGASKFPLTLKVASLMPMPTVFPEVRVSLRSVAAAEGNSLVITVQNMDRLQRFASSIEQVAELNKLEEAITLESDEEDSAGSDSSGSDSAGSATTNEASTKSSATEQTTKKSATRAANSSKPAASQ